MALEWESLHVYFAWLPDAQVRGEAALIGESLQIQVNSQAAAERQSVLVFAKQCLLRERRWLETF